MDNTERKMKKPVNYYYLGYDHGRENKPKEKGLKGTNKAAYENGYKAGHLDRSTITGQLRKMRG